MQNHTQTRNTILFLIPSILGIFFFMTPIPFKGQLTIPIAILKDMLLGGLGDYVFGIITMCMVFSGLSSLFVKLFQPKFIENNQFLKGLFNITPIWLIVRLIGTAIATMVYFNFGPSFILNSETGSFVFNDLLPTLFAVFIFAGFLLPLLTHFGMLEMFGTLLTKLMRPIFKLPGRSAIDCMASWLGDGSVGVLMSSKQYEEKKYTQRESAIIGTTFSAVSISFCLVVISQLGLDHMFLPFYLTVCITGTLVAIIVSRIPPLSRKKDELIDGSKRTVDSEVIPDGVSVIEHGLYNARKTVDRIDRPVTVIYEGFKNAVDMILGILPVVLAVGTCGLIVATYTPLFEWLGYPFIPLLKGLQIPMAEEVSKTMMVGFIDMFIPSILASSFESEAARFLVGVISVTQLIFMSEIGALLLGSKIPVSIIDLFIIFIQRTIVSLPIVAIATHIIF